jgi:hypothetical protein
MAGLVNNIAAAHASCFSCSSWLSGHIDENQQLKLNEAKRGQPKTITTVKEELLLTLSNLSTSVF